MDERLAFHHFLASDLPLTANPTTGSASTKEPDVATIRVFENPLLVGEGAVQQASITVIEIKRPMREGYQAGESEAKGSHFAIAWLSAAVAGGCAYRPRPADPKRRENTGFVYVLADLTNSLVDCCKMHQLRGTADGMGYFGYHRDESYNAYIQVISFDGLVQAAKERNRAFFDTLGLPAS